MGRIHVTENDLLAVLREMGKVGAQRPEGEGWFTVNELAEKEQTTVAAIKYRMKIAKKRGVEIESTVGSALDTHGQAKRSAFYRLKVTK